jgi:hypothetical protein
MYNCVMRKLLMVFCLYLSLPLKAQEIQLSDKAEIHVLTCGPYIGELYSAFGHSAIRVYDPVNRIDLIYNYGVFDFDQPNFYLNFARGYLYYKLAVQEYANFRNSYIYFNRFIHEQQLNLTAEQKQKVFNFLQWNALPENQYYTYDYFYDNCATRVRDAFVTALGDEIVYDLDYVEGGKTIRQLTDLYLDPFPWGDLGIDLGLGIPMDKKATSWEYMFLPDYIEQAFSAARIYHGGSLVPLVKKNIVTYASVPVEDDVPLVFTPAFLFWMFFAIILVVTLWQLKIKQRGKWLDFVLFFTTGLLGFFLLLLWFATNHEAAAYNLNILWAFPASLPIAFWLTKNTIPNWIGIYFGALAALLLLLSIFWMLLPQHLHYSLIPICMLLALRAGKIYFFDRKLIDS